MTATGALEQTDFGTLTVTPTGNGNAAGGSVESIVSY